MKRESEDFGEIRAALRRDPDDPQALKAIGKYYLNAGRYKQAQNHYIHATNISPRLRSRVLLDYENIIAKYPYKLGARFSLAGYEIVQGEIEAAILELEETLEIDPKNFEAYNVLGKIYVKQGRFDEVIDLLERSLRFGIKDVSLTEILAGAYLEKNRIPEAAKFYNEILKYRPGDKQTLRILGELYTRMEDYNRAAQSYQAMFSDDPEVSREVIQRLESLQQKQESNVLIREILADIYMRSLKPESAVVKLKEIMRLDKLKVEEVIARLKTILKNYPGHPETSLALAEALRRQGSYSEAIEAYHDLVRTKPDYLDDAMAGYQAVLKVCPEQILARTYLAEAYLDKKQLREALAEFSKMLQADPSSAEAVIRRCREISKTQPELIQARLVLGQAYLTAGDVQRASVEAEAIIAVDKKCSPAYLLLGEAYLKMRLCRKAVTILAQALTMDPYDLKVQAKYREAREKEIELETDKTRKRIAEDPWKMSLHLDLAKLHLQKSLQEEAIRELQLAVRDQARAPFAFNLLGGVYRGQGRYDQAAAQFNRALELAPAELADFRRLVRFNLGTTYEAVGQVSKALKAYEAVLQEQIDFGDLQHRVKYLKGTSLKSMQAKALLLVLARPEGKEVVALWGREAKAGRSGRREEMSVSFGQNHNTAGYDLFMRGMHEAALEEFQLAVQLDVKFAAALNNLGCALVKQGKYHEARSRLEDAVSVEPGSVVFRNNLGLACFLLNQLDQAGFEIERAYTIDPESSGVCINLGDLCYLKQDTRRALDLYRRTGSYDPISEIAEERLRFKTPQLQNEQ